MVAENGDATARAHRPTLLIAHGALGSQVLRRLLAAGAERGVLSWEKRKGAVHEGRLRGLELLLISDADTHHGHAEAGFSDGHESEMMQDLYRQIRDLGAAPTDATLSKALQNAVDRLLAASARVEQQDPLPLGLDVIFVSHIDRVSAIGLLDHYAQLVMRCVTDDRPLERGPHNADAVSFIQILDFENYWISSPLGEQLRKTLHRSLTTWTDRAGRQQPAFRRSYLVDGSTAEGRRKGGARVDEIGLFLELLLFEGQRAGRLQKLFQPVSVPQGLLGTFGVRVMERSPGLLKRLAAAQFADAWLTYISSSKPADPPPNGGSLSTQLKEATHVRFIDALGLGEIDTLLDRKLQGVEREVLSFDPGRPDWPDLVLQRWQEHSRDIEQCVAELAHDKIRRVRRSLIDQLKVDLGKSITKDLTDSQYPLPIGCLVDELESHRDALAQAEPELTEPSIDEPDTSAIVQIHRRYRRFLSERIQVEELKRWWYLQALAFAGVLTPELLDTCRSLAKPPSSGVATAGLATAVLASPWVANPITIASTIVGIALLIGRGLAHRKIQRRLERARQLYVDPSRGRIADCLRKLIGTGGALRQPLADQVKQLQQDALRAVINEVVDEIDSALLLLRQRLREIDWLRQQMREFGRSYGMESPSDSERFIRPQASGIRLFTERVGELDRLRGALPASAGKFAELQAGREELREWRNNEGGGLLDSLGFLDSLSEQFASQHHTVAECDPRDLEAFVKQWRGLTPAFYWAPRDGVPEDERYCILPRDWIEAPRMDETVRNLGVGDVIAGDEPGRTYLLCVKHGVDLARLLE